MGTAYLECCGGERNMSCSGEMLRYDIEHQLRRQLTTEFIDAEARKRGDQTGLDTLVVHALNYDYWTFAIYSECLSESIK